MCLEEGNSANRTNISFPPVSDNSLSVFHGYLVYSGSIRRLVHIYLKTSYSLLSREGHFDSGESEYSIIRIFDHL